MPLKLLKVDPQNESAWKLHFLISRLLQPESQGGHSEKKDAERRLDCSKKRFGALFHLT